MTTLYGPTEMIDGGFLWVKRCWVLAMARGALLRGISWFMSNCYEVCFFYIRQTVCPASVLEKVVAQEKSPIWLY